MALYYIYREYDLDPREPCNTAHHRTEKMPLLDHPRPRAAYKILRFVRSFSLHRMGAQVYFNNFEKTDRMRYNT